MANYIDIYTMQAGDTLRKQVASACLKMASYVLGEQVTAAHHDARAVWAWRIYEGEQRLFNRMLAEVASSGSIQNNAPNGPWLDTDVQYVVDALIDRHVLKASAD